MGRRQENTDEFGQLGRDRTCGALSNACVFFRLLSRFSTDSTEHPYRSQGFGRTALRDNEHTGIFDGDFDEGLRPVDSSACPGGERWKCLGTGGAVASAGAVRGDGEDLVVADAVGAGPGQLVAYSEGGEAAMPYMPAKRPVDAHAGILLDRVTCHKVL